MHLKSKSLVLIEVPKKVKHDSNRLSKIKIVFIKSPGGLRFGSMWKEVKQHYLGWVVGKQWMTTEWGTDASLGLRSGALWNKGELPMLKTKLERIFDVYDYGTNIT